MGGGALPFLVGGVICLVNSVNERDLSLLNSVKYLFLFDNFLDGLCVSNARKFEAITGPVMPFNFLGCTRATLMHSTSL